MANDHGGSPIVEGAYYVVPARALRDGTEVIAEVGGRPVKLLASEMVQVDDVGGGGGATDHGALTGLADDDHTQYHTDARGDARYSQLGHGHIIGDTTGLQTALDGKAATSHTHDDRYYTESEVDSALAGKAATSHTHAQSDVTDLVADLAGKAATSHTHVIGDTTGLQTALDGKAATSHTHIIADVTSLQTTLDAKVAKSTLTTKGDIYAATASATPARLAAGANGKVLMARSSESTGLAWVGQIVAAARASDFTVNNTTSYATALSLSGMDTSSFYAFDACLYVNSSTTADWKCNWSGPTGMKMYWHYDLDTTGVTAVGVGGGQGFQAAGSNKLVFLRGIIEMGTTSGDASLGFAQLSAEVSDTKLLTGSWVKAVLVGQVG